MMTVHVPETPLHPLPRLSELAGREIWIKRDDANGDILTAGNKKRKLVHLLEEAVRQGADTVLTTGGPQSNHARATAAMAVSYGLKPVLVLAGSKPRQRRGNLLLDHLVGAEVWFSGARTEREMEEALLVQAERVRAAGGRPYVIGIGGSDGLGSLGYVDAYAECKRQAEELGVRFDWLFVAAGSGGTAAGLIYGRDEAGDETRIVGISPWLSAPDITRRIDRCLDELRALRPSGQAQTGHTYEVSDAYLGKGYGHPTEAGMEALGLLARTEGILLDHVYTAKAMAGCLDYIRQGRVRPGERVLFWHTGGAPGLFALEALASRDNPYGL